MAAGIAGNCCADSIEFDALDLSEGWKVMRRRNVQRSLCSIAVARIAVIILVAIVGRRGDGATAMASQGGETQLAPGSQGAVAQSNGKELLDNLNSVVRDITGSDPS